MFLQVTRTIDKVVLNLWRRDVPPMVNVRKMKSAVCLRERNPVFLHVQLWIVDLAVFVLLEIMLPNVHVLQVRIFQIYFVCIYFCKMKEPIVLNWNNELIKSTQYKKLAPNAAWCLIFFMWFARFQILISDPKAFDTSFLYWVDFTTYVVCWKLVVAN